MKNKSTISISGIKEIYENYDAFILDQWGVMHDGNQGYIHAISCIEKLIKKNKILTIISNSSKRKDSTKLHLPQLGYNPQFFKEVMTSGEMIWQSLANQSHKETKNLGKNCFHIYDQNINGANKFLNGIDRFNIVENIEEADFILGCTPFANKKIIDYISILDVAKKKNLPFICANPDFETIQKKSSKLVFCMGTIAEIYKNIGGKVFILGKPNIEVYKQVKKQISKINNSKILAIGDSLYHDIKGAENFGIDSLLITSDGIHKNYFDAENPIWESADNSLTNLGIKPTYICSKFIF